MKLNNLYDFDKTILKKDGIVVFYFYLLKQKFFLFWHFFVVSFLAILYFLKIVSVEKLKENLLYPLKFFKDKQKVLENFSKKAKKYCNPYYLTQMKDDDVVCTASPTFLTTAIMKEINPKAVIIGSDVDLSTLKFNQGAKNCKGAHKIECLKKFFNAKNIECENAYSDSLSDIYLFDIAKNAFLIVGGKPTLYKQNGVLQKIPFNLKLKTHYIIKMMRPKHYIKNLLIFFPLFLAGSIFVWNKLLIAALGFLAFCLISSFVYIVNDLYDLEHDKKHNTKRLRAVASGIITKTEAIVVAAVLFALSTTICLVFTNYIAFLIMISYAFLNICYSGVLKNIPVLDLVLLAVCYVARVIYGGFLTSEAFSLWILLTVFAMAMFVGIIKRKNEILTQNQTTRKVNQFYSPKILAIFEIVFAFLTAVFYGLFVFFLTKNLSFGLNNLLLCCGALFVVLILDRYVIVTNKSGNSGNPMEVLFKDIWLVGLVFAFLIVTTLAIYVQFNYYSWCLILFLIFAGLTFVSICIPPKIYRKTINCFKKFFKKHGRFAEVLRFLIVGGSATLIDFFVTGLVEYFLESSKFSGLLDVFINSSILTTQSVVIGNAVGFFVGLIFNYIFSIVFVYKENGNSKTLKGFVLFTILSLIGLAINLVGMYFMFDTLKINQWISKVVMTIIVLTYNYISRKYLIFNKKFTKEKN